MLSTLEDMIEMTGVNSKASRSQVFVEVLSAQYVPKDIAKRVNVVGCDRSSIRMLS